MLRNLQKPQNALSQTGVWFVHFFDLNEKGPAPSVDRRSSFYDKKDTTVYIFRLLYTIEIRQYNVPFDLFCQLISLNLSALVYLVKPVLLLVAANVTVIQVPQFLFEMIHVLTSEDSELPLSRYPVRNVTEEQLVHLFAVQPNRALGRENSLCCYNKADFRRHSKVSPSTNFCFANFVKQLQNVNTLLDKPLFYLE